MVVAAAICSAVGGQGVVFGLTGAGAWFGCEAAGGRTGAELVRCVLPPELWRDASAIATPASTNTAMTMPTTSSRVRRRGCDTAAWGSTTMSSPSRCASGAPTTTGSPLAALPRAGSARECSGPPVVVTLSPWRPPTRIVPRLAGPAE